MLILRSIIESSLLNGLVPDDVVVCVLLGGEVHGQDGDVRGEGPNVETVDTHLQCNNIIMRAESEETTFAFLFLASRV